MNDRSTFDAFEQRLAHDLARYVQPAVDPRPTTEIADAAMQPRGAVVRVRNSSYSGNCRNTFMSTRSGHRARTSTPRSVICVTPRAGRSSRPAWAR